MAFEPGDVAEALALIDRYRELGIGAADASVLVIAARHDPRLLTWTDGTSGLCGRCGAGPSGSCRWTPGLTAPRGAPRTLPARSASVSPGSPGTLRRGLRSPRCEAPAGAAAWRETPVARRDPDRPAPARGRLLARPRHRGHRVRGTGPGTGWPAGRCLGRTERHPSPHRGARHHGRDPAGRSRPGRSDRRSGGRRGVGVDRPLGTGPRRSGRPDRPRHEPGRGGDPGRAGPIAGADRRHRRGGVDRRGRAAGTDRPDDGRGGRQGRVAGTRLRDGGRRLRGLGGDGG